MIVPSTSRCPCLWGQNVRPAFTPRPSTSQHRRIIQPGPEWTISKEIFDSERWALHIVGMGASECTKLTSCYHRVLADADFYAVPQAELKLSYIG